MRRSELFSLISTVLLFLALEIASIHNLAFYLDVVKTARRHIIAGDFTEWKRSVIDDLGRRV